MRRLLIFIRLLCVSFPTLPLIPGSLCSLLHPTLTSDNNYSHNLLEWALGSEANNQRGFPSTPSFLINYGPISYAFWRLCNLLPPCGSCGDRKRLDLRGFSSVLIGPWAEQITPTLYRGLSATFYKHVCALCVLTQIPRVSCLRVQ